jgi:diguanylate cyclase (GGDEF)-like protein
LLPKARIPVTVSLGVASLNGKENAKTLFNRADRALYQAKAEGRNCVCLADSGRALT